MKPILYESTETDFTTNGLGRLSEAVSAVVTEELNGQYTLEVRYPINGIHAEDIQEERIICAMPADGQRMQPFRIFKISKPQSGIFTVYAQHISYQLQKIVTLPFEAYAVGDALSMLKSHAVDDCPFSFWTDKENLGNFEVAAPSSIRSRLGGSTGSVIDIYGGEFSWDYFTVRLHERRGSDKGVTLRRGKNIADLKKDSTSEPVYTAIVPYYKDNNGILYIDGVQLKTEYYDTYPYHMTVPVDLSSRFTGWEEAPDKDDLLEEALAYLEENEGWELETNIKVSFTALWQSEEYKDVAQLERVQMGDFVTVVYSDLGVNHKLRVIKTKYDVLLERYDSIELGASQATLTELVTGEVKKNVPTTSDLQAAIDHATELITGGLGGHVVFTLNANGKPEEILIMDTEDKATAVNVWRWNQNGWGHSSSGYEGPYTLAATLDGGFVADFITTGHLNASLIDTGTLNANVIRAGILADTQGNTTWNLKTGDLTARQFHLMADKLDLNSNGMITSGKDPGRKITIYDGKITGYFEGKEKISLDLASDGFHIKVPETLWIETGSEGTILMTTNGGIILAEGDFHMNGNINATQMISAPRILGNIVMSGNGATSSFMYAKSSMTPTNVVTGVSTSSSPVVTDIGLSMMQVVTNVVNGAPIFQTIWAPTGPASKATINSVSNVSTGSIIGVSSQVGSVNVANGIVTTIS